ncbi:Uncharacterised protein [Mycolicibacterium vanbaalenii]|uniref:Uncharacterized protein n=1 Tax=Mycolicibacterium vanbaalenii TaxID=110539 RepID=A0A5S9RA32_MYCVN|nr:hypothetical protein [Mycolicibacterium vanbaalenii]CAA0136109.1 Uncharacterised protein [Mycolicibacterium vanbaalenii]
MNPTEYLLLGVEQYLRELPDDEFNDLMQKVRPPDGQDPPKTGSTAFIRQIIGGDDD